MIEFVQENTIVVLIGIGGLLLFQLLTTLFMAITLWAASRDRASLSKEMFGLMRKIEGLTANERDLMLKHYDNILEDLSSRLPSSIAAQAGDMIFQTESQVLTRLAELEPNLASDEDTRLRMDKLIQSMENLEARVVSITAEAVENVMAENRRDLFKGDYQAAPLIPPFRNQ